MNTHHRAVDVFTAASNRNLADFKSIIADHSARGLLHSGATAKRAVKSFEDRAREGLNQVLAEVSNRVDHRGRHWRREMADVERALNEHIASAPELLADIFRVAGTGEGAAADATSRMIEWSAHDLRKDFEAYRDGWTSPRARPWTERNAIFYAILLLAAGAIVSQAGNWVTKHLSDEKLNAPIVNAVKPQRH